MQIQTIGAPRASSPTDNVVPLCYRMKDGGMELLDGTLIVDCGHGVGISQPLGDGTEQAFFIDRRGLSALISCLRTLEKVHAGEA